MKMTFQSRGERGYDIVGTSFGKTCKHIQGTLSPLGDVNMMVSGEQMFIQAKFCPDTGIIEGTWKLRPKNKKGFTIKLEPCRDTVSITLNSSNMV